MWRVICYPYPPDGTDLICGEGHTKAEAVEDAAHWIPLTEEEAARLLAWEYLIAAMGEYRLEEADEADE